MDKRSTSVKIFDLPRLEELNDSVTANTRGGGISPKENVACTGLGAFGFVFGGGLGGILVGGLCLAAANAYD
jgi:hypothetical protein